MSKKEIQNKTIHLRTNKITFLFFFILLAMGIFLSSVFHTIHAKRRIPSQNVTITDRSFRGSIISADHYTLSSSQKTYKAIVRGKSIDPDKKALFIKLFSIYSGISEKKLLKRFKNRKGKEIQGNIVLSRTIYARAAMQLKSLAYKLRKLDVFRSIKTRNGIEVVYGLDIVENGEKRHFPLHDVFSPILGYVGNKCDGKYTRPVGKKGLERSYEKYITSKKNGSLKGKRDVVASIIHDKNSINIPRVDGLDLHLNIPLSLQRRVEMMIDQMRESINAEEIIVGIMESKTGKLLSCATTKRYDPANIHQKDIASLVAKFAEYPYEVGSVMKPITLAIALDHKVVTPNTWFDTHYKHFEIGKNRFISDDEHFDALTTTDIIVHSSNIGISQVSWRLTGKEFRDGLLKFGVAKHSGIDLSRDLPGSLKSVHLLNHKLHRANTSYGYGMQITFSQLLKAYSAFNNGGKTMTPRIVDYLQDAKGSQYTLEPKEKDVQAVSKKTAHQIHTILKEVVKRGTGKKAQYTGLEVGGKTGTAHIVKNGHYVNEYHSSFYGFANDDKGHKYTLGVLVIRAKKYHTYFASKSAVPTFRRLLDILVELNYLHPKDDIASKSDALPISRHIAPVPSPTAIIPTKALPKPMVKKESTLSKKIHPTSPKKPSNPKQKQSNTNKAMYQSVDDLF